MPAVVSISPQGMAPGDPMPAYVPPAHQEPLGQSTQSYSNFAYRPSGHEHVPSVVLTTRSSLHWPHVYPPAVVARQPPSAHPSGHLVCTPNCRGVGDGLGGSGSGEGLGAASGCGLARGSGEGETATAGEGLAGSSAATGDGDGLLLLANVLLVTAEGDGDTAGAGLGLGEATGGLQLTPTPLTQPESDSAVAQTSAQGGRPGGSFVHHSELKLHSGGAGDAYVDCLLLCSRQVNEQPPVFVFSHLRWTVPQFFYSRRRRRPSVAPARDTTSRADAITAKKRLPQAMISSVASNTLESHWCSAGVVVCAMRVL